MSGRKHLPEAEAEHVRTVLWAVCVHRYGGAVRPAARALGLAPSSALRVLAGEAEPGYPLAFALAELLGVCVYAVLNRPRPPARCEGRGPGPDLHAAEPLPLPPRRRRRVSA